MDPYWLFNLIALITWHVYKSLSIINGVFCVPIMHVFYIMCSMFYYLYAGTVEIIGSSERFLVGVHALATKYKTYKRHIIVLD